MLFVRPSAQALIPRAALLVELVVEGLRLNSSLAPRNTACFALASAGGTAAEAICPSLSDELGSEQARAPYETLNPKR